MPLARSTVIALLATALAAGTATASDTGGAAPGDPPHGGSVICVEGCTTLSIARVGSTVRVAGAGLDQVTRVLFAGGRGKADDRLATPDSSRARVLLVTVPAGAASGPLRLVGADGTTSDPTPVLQIATGPQRVAATGGAPAVDARVAARRSFYDGPHPAGLRYMVEGTRTAGVAIELVRATGGAVVHRWAPLVVPPGSARSVSWNGSDATTGHTAVGGRYLFRVYTVDGGAHAAQISPSAQPAPTASRGFEFLDHEFPIRGPHRFGSGEARFGAQRTGHIHQGQDTFAACGTPLVAARGGVVKFAGFQAAAGNYIVINTQGSGIDEAYMHLRAPALLRKGQTVRTGQRIGDVGRTGDATACHLHFEEWTAPGWYSGGHPIDPLADLRAWDRFS